MQAQLTDANLRGHQFLQVDSIEMPYYDGQLVDSWRYVCEFCLSPGGLQHKYFSKLSTYVAHIMDSHLDDDQYAQMSRILVALYPPRHCGPVGRERGSSRSGSARGSIRGGSAYGGSVHGDSVFDEPIGGPVHPTHSHSAAIQPPPPQTTSAVHRAPAAPRAAPAAPREAPAAPRDAHTSRTVTNARPQRTGTVIRRAQSIPSDSMSEVYMEDAESV
jgi:hypothetical protein